MTHSICRLISITKSLAYLSLMVCSCLLPLNAHAQEDGLGQTIQINTRFHSFVGKPSWLLVIRDLDHDQNIPYLYDIERGDHFWLALTYGRNYLILASTLYIETYGSRYNRFKKYTLHNFCQLESQGRIIRGESLSVSVEGDLTSNPDTVHCTLSHFPGPDFGAVRNDTVD